MVTKEATGYTDASPICGNAFSPYGYPGNGCIKVIPPEEVIQDPYHQRLRRVKKDQWDAVGIHGW